MIIMAILFRNIYFAHALKKVEIIKRRLTGLDHETIIKECKKSGKNMTVFKTFLKILNKNKFIIISVSYTHLDVYKRQ